MDFVIHKNCQEYSYSVTQLNNSCTKQKFKSKILHNTRKFIYTHYNNTKKWNITDAQHKCKCAHQYSLIFTYCVYLYCMNFPSLTTVLLLQRYQHHKSAICSHSVICATPTRKSANHYNLKGELYSVCCVCYVSCFDVVAVQRGTVNCS